MPRAAHRPADDSPVLRVIETSERLARVETQIEGLGDRLSAGFERQDRQFEAVNATLEKLGTHLSSQDKALQSVTESRDRQRKWVRWAAGIVATLVGSYLAIKFGLK